MANKRIAAVVACALLLVLASLILFWRSPNPHPPSEEITTASAPPNAPVAAEEKKGEKSSPSSIAAATPSFLGKNPRPITDAPHFSTMQEYRAEQSARILPPESLIPPPAGRTPESEVQRIQGTVRKYRAAFGENPVGSNPEITRALAGKNPTGAKFLDPATTTLNDKAEMLDDWGTPYFFHPVSGSIMEIRSAGPDKKLFTADDIVK